jgi:protein SCO1
VKRLLVLLAFATLASAQTSTTPPKLPGRVDIAQKLDSQIPLDLQFRDEAGRIVKLRDYFQSGRPVLLNFVYYRCPMLCPTVMESLTSALTELKFDIGKQYDVITVSIDPRDMPEDAAKKKDHYLKRYGRFDAASGWHFLTGADPQIKQLASAAGFEYAYDPQLNQFAHGTALLVLTPQGRISRYFYGFEYQPRDLRLGLVEASANKIGTPADAVLLMCYHYDPAVGKYSRSAMAVVRAGGAVTVISLAGFILLMLRSERRKASGQDSNR